MTEKFSCYADFFPSTRQKMAAWELWRKWGAGRYPDAYRVEYGKSDEAQYLDEFIYFLCNATPRAEFLEYCMRSEGCKTLEEYIGAITYAPKEDIPGIVEWLSREKGATTWDS